jgi:hypothetical protein
MPNASVLRVDLAPGHGGTSPLLSAIPLTPLTAKAFLHVPGRAPILAAIGKHLPGMAAALRAVESVPEWSARSALTMFRYLRDAPAMQLPCKTPEQCARLQGATKFVAAVPWALEEGTCLFKAQVAMHMLLRTKRILLAGDYDKATGDRAGILEAPRFVYVFPRKGQTLRPLMATGATISPKLQGRAITWHYHVALIVRVKGTSRASFAVFDPALSPEAPMLLHHWMALMPGVGSLAICSPLSMFAGEACEHQRFLQTVDALPGGRSWFSRHAERQFALNAHLIPGAKVGVLPGKDGQQLAALKYDTKAYECACDGDRKCLWPSLTICSVDKPTKQVEPSLGYLEKVGGKEVRRRIWATWKKA